MRTPKNRRSTTRRPFRLAKRDPHILRAINDCKLLLETQIRMWFFGSKSPCQARLRKLYDQGYLERHFITVAGAAPAASPILYSITERARLLLVHQFGYTPYDFRKPSQKLLNNWSDLQHLILLNDFRAALARALADRGWELVEWLDETHFRANPDLVSVTQGGGRTTTKPVLPDGYFYIAVPDKGKARFFVEADRGTEGAAQFKSQIDIYQSYITSGQYQARFQAQSLRILIYTPSPRRLISLKQAVKKAGGDGRYWFTTKAQVQPETILTAPIWQRLGDDDGVALVEG